MNKSAHTNAPTDWHRADIVAALWKAGWSIRKLSRHHGYASPTTLVHALDHRWPKGERIIAAALGLEPATIWPSRYAEDSAEGGGASHGVRQKNRGAA
ncbi:helix-turn-helix domain-containing protein [Spiribacter halobius]|uniref:Transcriptional regulator n=1 Tax=Sediminicurvatus halobius TaxID=2182432 RepID=A0A2U2N1G8_9GAMM|nr:helix-turn-helix domain-containing protein [Spiribacter halobius]PWG62819.1 transcriptional regulator [Spiribacter halobius]UEX77032.1 helix-turn-helix domain-containing protein [Spiribacter halobius]